MSNDATLDVRHARDLLERAGGLGLDARPRCRRSGITAVPDLTICTFDAERAASLMPGMTCPGKLVPYLKRDALAVPAKAVFTDPLDEENKYVWVLGADATPRKRRVAVGRKSDQKVEIVRGLKPGETVSLEEPKPTADQGK